MSKKKTASAEPTTVADIGPVGVQQSPTSTGSEPFLTCDSAPDVSPGQDVSCELPNGRRYTATVREVDTTGDPVAVFVNNLQPAK